MRNFQKLIILILCIFLFTNLDAQTVRVEEIVYWTKDKRLTFDDFRGKPKQEDTTLREASAKMMTHKLGTIILGIDVLLMTEPGKTVFTIRAGMKRNLSWIKDYGDTISLKHEQGHFDICEIYVRMLRRDIKQARSLSEAKDIFSKVSTEEELEQDDYDEDNTVKVGGITEVWRKKITNRLIELGAYEDPVVTVPIDK